MDLGDEMTFTHNFWADECGATAIEYALIGSLVSVAIVVALGLINSGQTGIFSYIQEEFITVFDR